MGQLSPNGYAGRAGLCCSGCVILAGAYLLLQYRDQLLGRDPNRVTRFGVGRFKNKEHILFHGYACADQFAGGCVSTLCQAILT